MRELQRLFAKLILSNQKYADPSDLLRNTTKDGKPVTIGDQQDVAGNIAPGVFTQTNVIRFQ